MDKCIGIIALSFFLLTSSAFADIYRVSVSSTGGQGNDRSNFPVLSEDGRYVVFASHASNLVAGDANNKNDVFIHDRQTGETELVNVSSTGVQANHGGFGFGGFGSREIFSLSTNGRFVAFESYASNLVERHTPGYSDVFVRDRLTGRTEILSVSSTGEPGMNGGSFFPSMSADARYVAFLSSARNLVDGDTNARQDIFVHDRQTGGTNRVSVSSSGEQGNDASIFPSLSADGRYVAFQSYSTNLVNTDTNNKLDVFVHDRQSRETRRVSVSSSGEQGNSDSGNPSLSADGRYIAFSSLASHHVRGDTNRNSDIFIHDQQSNETMRVSVSSTGEQANGSSYLPSLSANGRYVTFTSSANNLVDGDTNDKDDLFVHDRETGEIRRINLLPTGQEQRNGESHVPILSADGQFVGFYSSAFNLVEGDTNNENDAFVVDNPLFESDNDQVIVEKRINNTLRETLDTAAKLSTGTLFKQAYKVTNHSPNRIYQVKVYEGNNLVCNLYALNPGASKQRCESFQTVLEGNHHANVRVIAKVSGSADVLMSDTDVYYTGLNNVTGKLRVTHSINNNDSDQPSSAKTLGSSQAVVQFVVENIGEIELYQVKTYHDPVSPVNSGWTRQCVIGSLKPGQIRYCKRDITLGESGLNQAMGRAQGRNAIRSATDIVNASNPTYFIVP